AARAEGERLATLTAQAAQKAAEKAATEATQAKNQEAERKKQAVEFKNRALAVLRAMTDEDVEQLLARKPTLGATERAYLAAIAARWEKFADEAGDDEEARAVRGEGYHRVSVLKGRLGLWAEAKAAAERSRDVRMALADQFPANREYQRDLGTTHHAL